MRRERGFTAVELLVVAAGMTVLIVLASVLLKPADNSAQQNDATRTTDVAQLMQALKHYYRDNDHHLPANLPAAFTEIKSGDSFNLCSAFVPKYITDDLPLDPINGVELSNKNCLNDGGSSNGLYSTGYEIKAESKINGTVVTIRAMHPQTGITISLSDTFN